MEANIAKSRLSGAKVFLSSCERWLKKSGSDVVYPTDFAHPPYRKKPDDIDFANLLTRSAGVAGMLASSGLFVLETGSDFFDVKDRRVDGGTAVHSLGLGSMELEES